MRGAVRVLVSKGEKGEGVWRVGLAGRGDLAGSVCACVCDCEVRVGWPCGRAGCVCVPGLAWNWVESNHLSMHSLWK